MNRKFDIFYFSSTHWDREWYQSFQGFRYRLVRMVDNLLDLFDKDDAYDTFHFDGQTIVLEDYTKIAPEKKEKLQKLIKERRILIGPWYVMPDEFLLSGESLIRNLMLGHKICKEWETEPWKYGYVCDIFGHIAQMPQILNGFDIKYSLLGRGTTETDPTYFRWQSPDGSECITYKLKEDGGYGNFKQFVYDTVADASAENPEFEEKLKNYIDSELERAKLPIVIIMDGIDHAEASVNTTAYIKKMAELYPEATIHHKNLCMQGEMVDNYRDSLPIISGELNKTAKDRHSYLHLITNTLSSYYPIKQQNDRCQNLLEKQTEPLCVLSMLDGININRSFVEEAYKYLIQNHPHDSICGCAIDQVHKDMEYRFDQTKEICKAVREDYLYQSMNEEKVDGDYENILTIYNTLPFDVDKTVTLELDFPQDYPAQYQEPFGYEPINSFRIYDSKGNEIPYQVIDIKRGAKKRIKDQVLRFCDIHTVTLYINVPACGTSQYRIVPSKTPVRYLKKMTSGETYAENKFIRVDILHNGSLKITDKKTGKTYSELGNLVDDGEIGDGWYHANPVNDVVVTSAGGDCLIEKVESGPARCVFKVVRYMELPDEILCDKFGKRRSDRRVKVKITAFVGLSEENRYVDVKMIYENTVRDHRTRMLLPTGITSDSYFSGQAFYCCERKTGIDYSTQNWRETDQYEKSTNGIFGKRDENGDGIAVVSPEGLHECAAYADDEGTLSVTLLRSFKTTVMTDGEIRCQINMPLEYSFLLVPIDEDVKYADLVKIQDKIATEILTTFESVKVGTALREDAGKLYVGGDNVLTSVIKLPESGENNAIIVRVFNASKETTDGFIKMGQEIVKVEKTNLNEEAECEIPSEINMLKFKLEAWKIATFKIYFNL